MYVNEDSPYFRYMNDIWYFGILLTNNKILLFDQIFSEHDDCIEVNMFHKNELEHICSICQLDPLDCIGAPCSRTRAIVMKNQIISIFEIADT